MDLQSSLLSNEIQTSRRSRNPSLHCGRVRDDEDDEGKSRNNNDKRRRVRRGRKGRINNSNSLLAGNYFSKETASRSTKQKALETADLFCSSTHNTREAPGTRKLLVVWYKWNELRVHDNEPLYHAWKEFQNDTSNNGNDSNSSGTKTQVLNLHVIEDELVRGRSRESGVRRCSARRALFWRNSILDLGNNLKKQFGNIDMPLYVIHNDNNKAEETENDGTVHIRKGGETPDCCYHYESVVQVFRNLIDNVSNRFDKIKVYTHDSFCDEEIQTVERIKNLCSSKSEQEQGLEIEFVTFWGGLTVHHKDDLPFGDIIENLPDFKGEFQKAVKGTRIRAPMTTTMSDGGLYEPTKTETISFQNKFCESWMRSYGKTVFCLNGNGTAADEDEARMIRYFDNLYDPHNPRGLEVIVDSLDPKSISKEVTHIMKRKDAKETALVLGKSTFLHAPPQGRTWIAGETAALEYLDFYLNEANALADYKGATESFNHGDANTPINAGSRLSPYLAFGNLSVRYLMHRVKLWERKQRSQKRGRQNGERKTNSVPRSKRLYQELIFRDFLRFLCLKWKTDLFRLNGPFRIRDKSYYWRHGNKKETQELFRRWRLGQTGIPFIDAGLRELALTGYMSHLHRQCCAAFLVRDLRIDWRWGAEHFESCLLDHTPDANWGNWSYRILPRPCLIPNLEENRKQYRHDSLCTTAEIAFWPIVHDSYLSHTLAWVPEVRKLRDFTLAREPWRSLYNDKYHRKNALKRKTILPYKDSGFWFCAANRMNWDYEYKWLKKAVDDKGTVWFAVINNSASAKKFSSKLKHHDFDLKTDYFLPLKTPISVELPSECVPVKNKWGETFSEIDGGLIFSKEAINLFRKRIQESMQI